MGIKNRRINSCLLMDVKNKIITMIQYSLNKLSSKKTLSTIKTITLLKDHLLSILKVYHKGKAIKAFKTT